MSFSVSRLYRSAICVLVTWGLMGQASATMNEVMDRMFNSMINVTPGSVYETQAAGVIAGPSMYVRNQISTIRPLVIDPPRLKTGCAGIDAYMGSFSFINKEALINMMRNIASNALPYAFKMAIGTLCPKCDNLMSELQKIADTMNKFNINSCRAAQGVMNSVMSLEDTGAELSNNWGNLIGTVKGIASDFSELATDPVTVSQARLKAMDPVTAQRELEYNSAWKSIAGADIARWYINTMSASQRTDFGEIVMSFTGTIVTSYVPDQSGTSETTQTKPIPPLLAFDDFLRGGIARNIWRCDEEVRCLAPYQSTATVASIRDEVELMLFGTPGVPGIIGKITQRGSLGGVYLSPDEQRFVEAAPGAIYANLKMLGSNPHSARVYATAISDWLAVEMTGHLLLDVLRNVRIGMVRDVGGPDGGRDPGASEFTNSLRDKEALIREEMRMAGQRMVGLHQSLALSSQIRQNLNQATASTARPSLVN